MWSKQAIFCDISVILTLVAVMCQASTLRPTLKGSTSATISVERFGGNTFYNYLKATPVTEASTDEENATEEEDTTLPPSTVASPVTTSDSSSSSESIGESDEILVSRASEDAAQILETTLPPPAVISNDNGESVPPAPAPPPEAVGEEGDSPSLPGQQDVPTPPPAEAVPGQPGEDAPDSSSSSSSSSEDSSSSSEEFREAYNRKVWEYSKVKSKDSLLLARLNSKLLARKEKANKYNSY